MRIEWSNPNDKEILIAPLIANERGNRPSMNASIIKSNMESNLKELGMVVMLEENQHENIAVKTIEIGQSLQNLFLMLLLACMMIEWWVSCREN